MSLPAWDTVLTRLRDLEGAMVEVGAGRYRLAAVVRDRVVFSPGGDRAGALLDIPLGVLERIWRTLEERGALESSAVAGMSGARRDLAFALLARTPYCWLEDSRLVLQSGTYHQPPLGGITPPGPMPRAVSSGEPVFVGLDVGERAVHVVAYGLDGSLRLAPERISSTEDTARRVSALWPWIGQAVVAIDAPAFVSRPASFCANPDYLSARGWPELSPKFREGRVAEAELSAFRGISVPWITPSDREACAPWVRHGLALFEAFRKQGLADAAVEERERTGLLLEVFPYSGLVALLGRLPSHKKGTTAWREEVVGLLEREGLAVHPVWDVDVLEAGIAALTARQFYLGQACGVGEAEEGLIWLPVKDLPAKYHREPSLL
ncbi:MAG: DUF429 domain-containing protein [Actinomycetota bacterium]